MEKDALESLFSNIARHVPVDHQLRTGLEKALLFRSLKRNHYLVHAGAMDRSSYFILKGCTRTYFIDRDGQEHVVQFALEDWWIGDLRSHVLQQPAQLNLQALEDLDLIEFPDPVIHDLYDQFPAFERFMRKIAQRSLVSFQERLVQLFSLTAEERYKAFRHRYPSLDQRLAQKQIAQYLGITPEFLSKIKSRLARADK